MSSVERQFDNDVGKDYTDTIIMRKQILQDLSNLIDEINLENILEKISNEGLTNWIEAWYNQTKLMVEFLIEDEKSANL